MIKIEIIRYYTNLQVVNYIKKYKITQSVFNMSSIANQDVPTMALFVDVSGSVGNFTKYWTKVSKFYQENLDNITKISKKLFFLFLKGFSIK